MLPIVILSDLARASSPGVHPINAALARDRRAFWPALAQHHGWDLRLDDAADVGTLEGALAWIDLPLLPRAGYRELHARAQAAGARAVLDAPSDVETVLGLDRAQGLLERAGLPVPRTALVPVDDATAALLDSPAAVRRLLTERVYEALFAAGIDPHAGVYVRGFSSSLKSPNPEHFFGDNQADIEATVFEVIRDLRGSLELVGLALREFLHLDRVDIPALPGARGGARVPFEVRLTVLGGRPFLASYHGPFDVLVPHARAHLAEALGARRPQVEAAIAALLPALLRAELPRNYVADLAFTTSGAPVVLELNPLYAAGYNLRAAHALVVSAIAAELAAQAGGAALGRAEIVGAAEAILGEPVAADVGFWLLDPPDVEPAAR